MKSYRIRSVAPRRPRARVRAATRDRVPWWLAGLIFAALAVAAATGHAQTLSRPPAGPAAVSPATPRTAAYVRQAALSDMLAINTSRIAMHKSQDPAVRSFAQQMLADHSRSTAQLREAIASGRAGVTLPTALELRQQEDVRTLAAKPLDQFDAAYLLAQLQTHRNALDVQRAYAERGTNAALRRFASQATPIIQRNLAKLEVLAQKSFAARMCRARGNAGGIGAA